MQNLLPFQGSPVSSGCPGEEPLEFSAVWLATPTLGGGGGCTPVELLPSTASPLEEPHSPEKLDKLGPTMQSVLPLWGGPASSTCPGEEPLGFSVAQLVTPTLGGVLHTCGTAVQHRQRLGRTPQPRNTRANSAWL